MEVTAKTDFENTKLNFAKLQLIVGKEAFFPKADGPKSMVFDLGRAYESQVLPKGKFNRYLLIYEIPDRLNNKKITLKYLNNFDGLNAEYIKIKVNPIDIDAKDKTESVRFNEEITLNKDILDKSTLQIKNIEVNKKFAINYKYCINIGECIDSVEYMVPKVNSNYEKVLIKIESDLILDKEINLNGVTNTYNLIEKFGTIVYVKNGNTFKIANGITHIPISKKKDLTDVYIEAPADIMDSTESYLLIKIRNKEYKIKFNIKNNEN